MLLALSVVFTYSFSAVGTAFAASGTADDPYSAAEVEAKLYDVISGYEKDMTGNIDRVIALYNLDSEDDYDVQVKEAAIREAAAEFIQELVDDMEKIADAEVLEADKGNYTTNDLDDAKDAIEKVVVGVGAVQEYTKYEKVADLEYASSLKEYYLYDEKGHFLPAEGAYQGTGRYFTITKLDPQPTEVEGNLAVQDKENEGGFVKASADSYSKDVIYYEFKSVGDLFVGDDVSQYFVIGEDGNYVKTNDTNAQPGTDYYKAVTVPATDGLDYTTISGFKAALDASGYIEKAEAPLAETYYKEKIEEDYPLSNYPADGSYPYDGVANLTGQEVVDAIKADALETISEAAKELKNIKNPVTSDYTTAIDAYKAAFESIATKITGAGVPTNEEAEDSKTEVERALSAAIAQLKAYALGTYTERILDVDTPQGTATEDLTDLAATYANSDIYTEKTATKNATLFGVEIKDIKKATRTEVLSVKSAFIKAMNDTVDTVEKSIRAKELSKGDDVKTAVEATYDETNSSVFTKTVKTAYKVVDKYDAVIARGDALKAATKAGEKLYDDEKVDSVVNVAAEDVYADMGAKSVEQYFLAAINEVFDAAYESYDAALAELLIPGDYEYDKLLDAIEEAKDKFQDRVITIGSDATPEADKKYCKNYYAVNEKNADGETYGELYEQVKADTKEALDKAQSYADIDEAMADADAQLAELMVAADAKAVTDARMTYCNALEDYAEEVKDIKGTEDYALGTYEAAIAAGKELINNATTVAAVKSAYEEAKDLFDTLKTDDELEALKEEIEKVLNDLPLASKVTSADAEIIENARDAYDAYIDTIGTENISVIAKNRLDNAENALYTLEAGELEAEVKALADKLAKIDFASKDVAVAELLALKDEMTALSDKVETFNQKMEDKGLELNVDADDIVNALNLAEGSVWYAEVYMTEVAIQKVLDNDDINMTDINVAFDAYKALTDRQQYRVDKDTNYAVDVIKSKIVKAVESLKITASSTAAKGSITVKWKVVGDYEAADGMRVYKSTKMNSGYGATPYFITKKGAMQYKNTKELKKGTRYYYKVRAYVEIDGVKYYSDYSNKAYRIAK